MPAYLIGTVTVRDPELWSQYVARVGETFALYGAIVLFRGRHGAQLAGESAGEVAVVAQFENLVALRRWHDSPEYQELVPLRDAAAQVQLAGYQG
jgi:uncharacterized protein (DUF1330 family)